MANGRMPLSIEGEEKLIKVMSHLEFNDKRPEALRLAFVKGLISLDAVPEKRKKETRFIIPDGVIARGEEYILFRHLLMEKIGIPLDSKTMDDYMLRYIEEGLELMDSEISSLTDLDNYLLVLIDKHGWS